MLLRQTVLFGNKVGNGGLPPSSEGSLISIPGKFQGKDAVLSLSKEQMMTHCLLLGATGSGKTNAILHMLRQIKEKMTAEDVMIVFDSKMDFRGFHGAEDVVITNVGNGHGAEWNLFMDLVQDGWDKEEISMNADEISAVIFSEAIEQAGEPFFPTAAREIFAVVLKAITYLGIHDTEHRIRYMNNESLRIWLNGITAARLKDILQPYPELMGALKYVGDGHSAQALGVFAELQAVTSKLFMKCFGRNGRFSIRRFERERGGRTLFVEYDIARGASFQPVYRILFDLFLKEALSPQQKKGKVYVICDELKLLPHMTHFQDALNFGRSLGITVIAGIQSMEQLYEVYGEYGGRNIASGFQTTFCFRTVNQASREYIKGIHGRNVVAIEYLNGMQHVTEQTRDGWTVEDWDLNGLHIGEAVVGLPQQPPVLFQIERYR